MFQGPDNAIYSDKGLDFIEHHSAKRLNNEKLRCCYICEEREMFILIYTGTNIPITQSVLLLLTRKKQDKKFSSRKWICFRLYSLWSVFPQGILTDWRSDWVSYCMIRSSWCSQLKIIHLRVRPHVRVMLMIGLHFIIGTNTYQLYPVLGFVLMTSQHYS